MSWDFLGVVMEKSLCIPILRILWNSVFTFRGADCADEATKTRQLMEDLGYRGRGLQIFKVAIL